MSILMTPDGRIPLIDGKPLDLNSGQLPDNTSSTDNSIGCLTSKTIGTVAFGVGTLVKNINEGTVHEGTDEDGIEYNIEQVLNDLTNVFKYGTINRLGQSIPYTKQQLAKAWVDMDINPDTNPIFWYFDKQVYEANGNKNTDPPRLNIVYEYGGFNSGTDNLNRMEGGTCSGIANIGITGTATSIEGLNNRVIDARYGHIEGRFNEVTGNFHHVEGSSNYVEGESNHAENSMNVVKGKYNHAESYDGHIISERGHIEGSGSRARVGTVTEFNGTELKIVAGDFTTQFKSLKVNMVLKIGLNYYIIESVTKPSNAEVTETSVATITVDKNIIASIDDEVYKVTHFNSGNVGHVEGKDNVNLAHSGHVEGQFNKLFEEAIASHAGGTSNQIWGENSLSTGYFNEILGNQSLSIGTHNKVYADNAAAIGMWNNARTPNGFVCGTYNAQATDVLLAVGNGTAANDRRDAFQVKMDGSAKVQGDIIANGININQQLISNLQEAKSYTDNEIAKFDFIKIVNELPEPGLPNRFYLVPKSEQTDNDLFDEYIWANKGTEENPIYDWEWVATKQVEVDLTNYATKDDAYYVANEEAWFASDYALSEANAYTDEKLTEANDYTDEKLAEIDVSGKADKNKILDYIGYKITNNEVSIEFSDNAMNISGKHIIPDTIEGYPVTSIGDGAFDNCYALNSIVIPNSVTKIGSMAFYTTGIKNITIPDSVTSIGGGAFSWCDSIVDITIPKGVTRIEREMFFCSINLKSVTIPEGVTSIGEYAFRGCDSLTDIYYEGTKEQWDSIIIENQSSEYDEPQFSFDNVTIHYNQKSATKEDVAQKSQVQIIIWEDDD